jgi:hypothetical protein
MAQVASALQTLHGFSVVVVVVVVVVIVVVVGFSHVKPSPTNPVLHQQLIFKQLSVPHIAFSLQRSHPSPSGSLVGFLVQVLPSP